jgi:hypothetical protein
MFARYVMKAFMFMDGITSLFIRARVVRVDDRDREECPVAIAASSWSTLRESWCTISLNFDIASVSSLLCGMMFMVVYIVGRPTSI